MTIIYLGITGGSVAKFVIHISFFIAMMMGATTASADLNSCLANAKQVCSQLYPGNSNSFNACYYDDKANDCYNQSNASNSTIQSSRTSSSSRTRSISGNTSTTAAANSTSASTAPTSAQQPTQAQQVSVTAARVDTCKLILGSIESKFKNDFSKSCRERFQAKIASCANTQTEAEKNCQEKTNEGMSNSASDVNQMLMSMSQVAAEGSTPGGTALLCKNISQALMAGNAAYQAFEASCSGYRTTCLQTCNPLPRQISAECGQIKETLSAASLEELKNEFTVRWPEYEQVTGGKEQLQACKDTFSADVEKYSKDRIDEVSKDPKDNIATCKNYESNVQNAQTAIANMTQTALASGKCKSALTNSGLNPCLANPTAAGCQTLTSDCSNPSVAASDPVCACRNPNSAACLQLTGGNATAFKGLNNSNGTPVGSGAAATTSGGSVKLGAEFNSLDGQSSLSAKSGDHSPGEDVGGSKGGKGLAGGDSVRGAGGAGAGSAGVGGEEGSKANILSGFRSGSGGGGGYGSPNYGYGTDGYGSSFRNPAVGSTANGGPDLKQFLPGGAMDPQARRGLAGIVGPDGISGPHADIWQNIKGRYQNVEPTLIQP